MPRIWRGRGSRALQPQYLRDALLANEALMRRHPDDARAHAEAGDAMVMMGREPEAILRLQTSIQLDPNADEAHYFRGLALQFTKRLPPAQREFEAALRLNPKLGRPRQPGADAGGEGQRPGGGGAVRNGAAIDDGQLSGLGSFLSGTVTRKSPRNRAAAKGARPLRRGSQAVRVRCGWDSRAPRILAQPRSGFQARFTAEPSGRISRLR